MNMHIRHIGLTQPERMKAPDRGESEASKTATWRRGEGVTARLNHQRMGPR